MGESACHIELVEQMADWVTEHILAGDRGMMMIDHPNSIPCERPSQILGFIPDLLVPASRTTPFVIGEAKTRRDLESRRTREQLSAFLQACAQNEGSYFILAVPWDMIRFARRLIQWLQERGSADRVSALVLEKLRG